MTRAFLLLCALAVALHAQSWDVVQALRPGDRVKVRDRDGGERKGAVAAVTADAISLRSGKSEISVARASVRRVQAKSGARRARNIAIGAGVGLAIGLVTDNTLGAYLRNESSADRRPLFYALPIALFGGIGAAFAPYKTIYRAP